MRPTVLQLPQLTGEATPTQPLLSGLRSTLGMQGPQLPWQLPALTATIYAPLREGISLSVIHRKEVGT